MQIAMFLGLDALTWAIVAVGLIIAGVIFFRDSKRGRAEWDPRPPTVRERIIAGVWLAAFLLAATNDYAGWRLFGGYDRWLLGGLMLGGLFLIARLPGVKRV